MWSFPEEVRYTTQYTTRQRLHIILLKVSKYQKHFFLKLHCPKKWMKNSTKFCPTKLNKANVEFVQYFVRFLDNGVSKRKAFEIYWPLVHTIAIGAVVVDSTLGKLCSYLSQWVEYISKKYQIFIDLLLHNLFTKYSQKT